MHFGVAKAPLLATLPSFVASKKGTYTAPASNLACRFLMKKWLIVSLRNVYTPYRTPYDEGGNDAPPCMHERYFPTPSESIPKALEKFDKAKRWKSAGIIAPDARHGECGENGTPSPIFRRSTATYCYLRGTRNAMNINRLRRSGSRGGSFSRKKDFPYT